jgi:hypothetical protein
MSEKAGLSVKKSEGKEKGPVSSSSKTDLSQSMEINSPVEQVLHLQHTIGNRVVTRLIQSGVLQAELKIGQPGDIYEQEADRAAEQVLRMPEPEYSQCKEKEEGSIHAKPIAAQLTPLVQRVPVDFENEEAQMKSIIQKQPKNFDDEEEAIQTKGTGETGESISGGIERQINSLKGSGQPMGNTERTFFEPRFGADFSSVRLHTGSNASEAARALNARAFTVGRDVVFAAGQYQPQTTAGKKLMAHELAHVIQQNAGISQLKRMTHRESTADSIRRATYIQRTNGGSCSSLNSALQWDYTFRRADGHIIATAKPCATLWGLARYWSWRGANYPAITYENGSRVTNPDLIRPGEKFDVFPIMPAFYRRMVGNTGTGNCANSVFAYLNMVSGPAYTTQVDAYRLLQRLSAGATRYAGNVVVWTTTGSAPRSASELVHLATYLADDYVFTKNGAGPGLYEVMRLSAVNAVYSRDGSIAGRWHG